MIPKVIHKIIITDDGNIPVFPEEFQKAIDSFRTMNPGYQIRMYSGKDCVAYIQKHFDQKTLNMYHALKPYAFKCDLMRQLILYHEGGWYSDIRQVCLIPLDRLNEIGKEYYTSVDCPPNQTCMYNAFIGSVAKHPISKKMIDLISWNVEHEHYGLDCLYVSGPGAYMTASVDYLRTFSEKCIVGQHAADEHVYFGNVKCIMCKYNNAKGADNTDLTCTNDYGKMWVNRDVYLKIF